MANIFPETSVTLIAKIKNLAQEDDSTAWVRFWDTYQGAIRAFAALKGGEQNADDIVMQVLEKLVTVLRDGQYVPEKGRFHSYLAMMILNEVRMAHRREMARAGDRKVSLDAAVDDPNGEEAGSLKDILRAPEVSPDEIDADWRKAVLTAAVEHVLTKTALSDRDRKVYRAYALEHREIGEVAAQFGLSRNNVSQIKTRIDKRIVDVGRRMIEEEL